MFSLEDLKKHLGPGMGLRKSKYLLEIPMQGVEGGKLNILCRSTSLPERNINTVDVYDKGRKYTIRGETDYIGDYTISILDDNEMKIRKLFDEWLVKVDNSTPKNDGILGALGNNVAQSAALVAGGLSAAANLKNKLQNNPEDMLIDALTGTDASATYMMDVNIWQLDNSGDIESGKVYGYQLQNAFPKSVGTVELDDGDENTLSEFSVTFAFSEFTPLENKSALEKLGGALLGDDLANAGKSAKNLFG
jgi:hypothetical protein